MWNKIAATVTTIFTGVIATLLAVIVGLSVDVMENNALHMYEVTYTATKVDVYEDDKEGIVWSPEETINPMYLPWTEEISNKEKPEIDYYYNSDKNHSEHTKEHIDPINDEEYEKYFLNFIVNEIVDADVHTCTVDVTYRLDIEEM